MAALKCWRENQPHARTLHTAQGNAHIQGGVSPVHRAFPISLHSWAQQWNCEDLEMPHVNLCYSPRMYWVWQTTHPLILVSMLTLYLYGHWLLAARGEVLHFRPDCKWTVVFPFQITRGQGWALEGGSSVCPCRHIFHYGRTGPKQPLTCWCCVLKATDTGRCHVPSKIFMRMTLVTLLTWHGGQSVSWPYSPFCCAPARQLSDHAGLLAQRPQRKAAVCRTCGKTRRSASSKCTAGKVKLT